MGEGTDGDLAELLSSIYDALGLALAQVGHPYRSFLRLLRRHLRRRLAKGMNGLDP